MRAGKTGCAETRAKIIRANRSIRKNNESIFAINLQQSIIKSFLSRS